MSSFLKIASGMLLPVLLALPSAGCVASADDDDADALLGESAQLDQASTTPPPDDNEAKCGPGTLIQQLPYNVYPGYYGGYGGYGGAPYYGSYYGGYGGAPYYGGYYGGYGGGYYNPGGYSPPGSNSGCGCP